MSTSEPSTRDGALSHPVMKQGGFYNQNSSIQQQTISSCLGVLERAAQAAPLPAAGGTFRITDLGCSQGRNSVAPISTVLHVLQSRAAAAAAGADPAAGNGSPHILPVEVLHEDLPDNDWQSLFGVVNGSGSYLPGPGECPHLQVFSAAVGRSFYTRLFAPASVHLAMAFNCLHWLRKMPPLDTRPADTLRPYATADPRVYEAFRSIAVDGLRRFLELRAAEVAPGGSLVFNLRTYTRSQDEENPVFGAPSVAALQMASEGLLTSDDVAELTMPLFLLEPRDVSAVLDDASDVWSVQVEEEAWVEHPAHAQHRAGQMPKEQVVAAFTGIVRAVSEPVFASTLGRRRPGDVGTVEELVAGIFQRTEALIAERLAPLRFKVLNLWLQRK